MNVKGRALKYGDNISTDQIFPGRFLAATKPEELAQAAMTGLDADFPKKAANYGLVAAGSYFGCGSSREHAPLSMKYAGVKCVIAESFARIFFRNAVNIGLPVVECKGIAAKIQEGDELSVDLAGGKISNLTSGETIQFMPLPSFLLRILSSGGLMEYINQKSRNQ
ncbi:MAG: 3-isopropylmalate dehydratase small subunit [Candidatus Bathyarchaeia archaeon]